MTRRELKPAHRLSPKRWLWLTLGVICVALGAIGVILPLLPTTPFMLLAAFAFARSSPRLHNWLINHRLFGPLILNWQRHGAISVRAKFLSMLSLAAVIAISLIIQVPLKVLIIQAVALTAVATFILSRPNPPKA